MYIKQIYTPCLAEAAYYIESNGEVAIIDPLRDVDTYLELANQRDAKIKYVFETHFHADFVSGHIDLSKKTGAEIVYGPTAEAEYEISVAKDMQTFNLGDIFIQLLHTPGHTMESSCFLLLDKFGKQHSVFTGDTLFVGDVGRPDLAVNSEISREDLATHLYHSIKNKLLTLNDDVIVYPGHGAGSQCGKSLGKETQSTIGIQKKYNYALNVKSAEDFVSKVTEGLTAPPQYFPKNAQINKNGYDSIDLVLAKSMNALTVEEFKKLIQNPKTIVIDSRNAVNFSKNHIKGSINIGLDGFFAVWVGTLIKDLKTPILLVCDKGMERETILRLARVGYENVLGYLSNGIENWITQNLSTEQLTCICPTEFINLREEKNIIDVRTDVEYNNGHVDESIHIPLAKLNENISLLNKKSTYYIYCKSGYRSAIASSFMINKGFSNIINIKKGYDGIVNKTCFCKNK